MRRTHIMIPDELVDEIDNLVGKRGRSAFIAEAASAELKRRQLSKALVRSKGAWKDENHPELRDGAAAFVHRQRREDEARDRKRRGRLSA